MSAEQKITPWEVQGEIVEGKVQSIDYNKLVEQFGTKLIDSALLERFEKLTGHKPHPFLRRGLFFSHRYNLLISEFDRILNLYEKGKPFYLYTGRGPSSGSMHVGHMVPFLFCKWLQDVFNAFLVIQLTDDEKFLFKTNLKIRDMHEFMIENAKDIISFGFNPERTFMFNNLDYMNPDFYKVVVQLSRAITYNQSKNTFGFNDSDNVGKSHFVSIQAAPSFSQAFPNVFKGKEVDCLIPCAIDQDPYFRLTRDVAGRIKWKRPSLLHNRFFPALQGPGTKMSASVASSAIFINDTPKMIKNKIKKYAFSGGGDTAEDHAKNGGNCEVDVAFQYLRFFLDDDAELEQIRSEYSAGKMNTATLKERCAQVVQELVKPVQEARAKITDDTIALFMDPTRPKKFDLYPAKVDPASQE